MINESLFVRKNFLGVRPPTNALTGLTTKGIYHSIGYGIRFFWNCGLYEFRMRIFMSGKFKRKTKIHISQLLEAVTLIWIFLHFMFSLFQNVFFFFCTHSMIYYNLGFLQYLCDLWLLSMLLSRLLRPPLQSISLGLNINSRDLLWIRSSSRSLSLIICCWAEQSSPSTLEDLFCFSVKWLMFPLMFWKNVKLGFLFWVFQKITEKFGLGSKLQFKTSLKNS